MFIGEISLASGAIFVVFFAKINGRKIEENEITGLFSLKFQGDQRVGLETYKTNCFENSGKKSCLN